jgi:IS30 family transposase
MKKINKIKAWERDQIAVWLASGASKRLISRKLGRSLSSILDEIKRNSIDGEYQAIKADELSQKRNRKSRKLNPLKNPQIYSYVYDIVIFIIRK